MSGYDGMETVQQKTLYQLNNLNQATKRKRCLQMKYGLIWLAFHLRIRTPYLYYSQKYEKTTPDEKLTVLIEFNMVMCNFHMGG